MFFVRHPKILHKSLLGVKMAARETENNAYAKFLGEKQRTLWYVMVFSGVVNFNLVPGVLSLCHLSLGMRDESTKINLSGTGASWRQFLKGRLAPTRTKILVHFCIFPSCLLLRVTFCAIITVSRNKGSAVLCKLELHVLREENQN